MEAEVVGGAAALAAEHAEAVGVVHHGEAAVLLADLGQLGQARDVALHRVDALDDQQLGGVGVAGGEDIAEVVGAVVREPLDGGAGDLDAVPEAGVEVLVGQDDVALLREGRHAGHDGKVAGGVDMAGLGAEERGELFLELDVKRARAVGGARAVRAGAPLARRGRGGLDDLRVEGEPEIVVARKHDHVAPTQADRRVLLELHRVVVRRILQPHLGRVVVATAVEDALFVFGEERNGHENGRRWARAGRIGNSQTSGEKRASWRAAGSASRS